MHGCHDFFLTDEQVSKVDDVCEDKDELTNERAEDSGLCQAEENGNDSTKVRKVASVHINMAIHEKIQLRLI